MIVCTYWTDERYAKYGARMVTSAQAVGLKTDCEFVPDRGSWRENTYYKPTFIKLKMEEHGQGVLWVDSDVVFRAHPGLITESGGFDVAAYFHTVNNPWAGTLYFAYGDISRRLLTHWEEFILEKQPAMDQDVLKFVLLKSYEYRILHLPPSYHWQERFMRKHFPSAIPVIEHAAVSRSFN